MIATAWNNGKHHNNGSGYGLKINALDRDSNFKRSWGSVLLELEGEKELVEVNIDKESFWNDTCRELISIRIGKWLISNNKAPWMKGKPPKVEITLKSDNVFIVTII
jgi:hypothetical protein